MVSEGARCAVGNRVGDPMMEALGHPLAMGILAFVGIGFVLVVWAWWWSSRHEE